MSLNFDQYLIDFFSSPKKEKNDVSLSHLACTRFASIYTPLNHV